MDTGVYYKRARSTSLSPPSSTPEPSGRLSPGDRASSDRVADDQYTFKRVRRDASPRTSEYLGDHGPPWEEEPVNLTDVAINVSAEETRTWESFYGDESDACPVKDYQIGALMYTADNDVSDHALTFETQGNELRNDSWAVLRWGVKDGHSHFELDGRGGTWTNVPREEESLNGWDNCSKDHVIHGEFDRGISYHFKRDGDSQSCFAVHHSTRTPVGCDLTPVPNNMTYTVGLRGPTAQDRTGKILFRAQVDGTSADPKVGQALSHANLTTLAAFDQWYLLLRR